MKIKIASYVQNGCRVSNTALDLGSQYTHAFWFGDMNYRVDLASTDTKERLERAHKEHFDEVLTLVEQQKWDKLLAADGLTRAMQAKEVLVGWTSAVPAFPPTFKVEREDGIKVRWLLVMFPPNILA